MKALCRSYRPSSLIIIIQTRQRKAGQKVRTFSLAVIDSTNHCITLTRANMAFQHQQIVLIISAITLNCHSQSGQSVMQKITVLRSL